MRGGRFSAAGGGAGLAHHRRPATPPKEPAIPSFVGHSLDVIANRAHPPTRCGVGEHRERGLSNVALHWMLGKARDCGLRIDRAGLASHPADPHGTMHRSWTGIWKARPRRTRKIPEGARVHRSVFDRRDGGRVRYNPKNLPVNPVVVS